MEEYKYQCLLLYSLRLNFFMFNVQPHTMQLNELVLYNFCLLLGFYATISFNYSTPSIVFTHTPLLRPAPAMAGSVCLVIFKVKFISHLY